jgi:FKBP-type peptidyl-prolyl cis-trans isomerase
MITTPSGLQYLDTTVGEGAEARKGPERHRALHRLALE